MSNNESLALNKLANLLFDLSIKEKDLLVNFTSDKIKFDDESVSDDEVFKLASTKKKLSQLCKELAPLFKDNAIGQEKIIDICKNANCNISDYLIKTIEHHLYPYYELAFVRKNPNAQELITALYPLWLHSTSNISSLLEDLWIDSSQNSKIRKFFNTASLFLIAENADESEFCYRCNEMFGFDFSLSNSIWNLMSADKKDIFMKISMQRLFSLENRLSKIENFWSSDDLEDE